MSEKEEYKEFTSNYKTLSSAQIFCADYQRDLDVKRVKKIVDNFNPNLVNPIKVSRRDGKYWVFDGQHTLAALVSRNEDNPTMVECKVYEGMTFEDEARLFALQTGDSRKVQSDQKLRALYLAKDIDVLDFKELVEANGYICDFKGYCGNGRLACYSTAFNVFGQIGGSDRLTQVLQITKGAWGANSDGVKREIISGLNILIKQYPDYNKSHMIKNLKKTTPNTIIAKGKELRFGGNKRFAEVIADEYNKNLRGKDPLVVR